jgi:hypothetical protein
MFLWVLKRIENRYALPLPLDILCIQIRPQRNPTLVDVATTVTEKVELQYFLRFSFSKI